VIGGDKLQIKGNEDGSVALLAPMGMSRAPCPATSSPRGHALVVLCPADAAGPELVAVGNGFFKPNLATVVGELYAPGDRRRDAGFTIFYMGINLGSLFSQLLCPWLADTVGWWAGSCWLPSAWRWPGR
jgi:POT family proton-dependent oligopeptide transporter